MLSHSIFPLKCKIKPWTVQQDIVCQRPTAQPSATQEGNTKIDEPKPGYDHFEREQSTAPYMKKDCIRVLHGQLLCVVNGMSL